APPAPPRPVDPPPPPSPVAPPPPPEPPPFPPEQATTERPKTTITDKPSFMTEACSQNRPAGKRPDQGPADSLSPDVGLSDRADLSTRARPSEPTRVPRRARLPLRGSGVADRASAEGELTGRHVRLRRDDRERGGSRGVRAGNGGAS